MRPHEPPPRLLTGGRPCADEPPAALRQGLLQAGVGLHHLGLASWSESSGWRVRRRGLRCAVLAALCWLASPASPASQPRRLSLDVSTFHCCPIADTRHSKLFKALTDELIKDALELWERLKTKKTDRMFSAENEEEFEDSNGNVFNKKTYEDLKRQDLL